MRPLLTKQEASKALGITPTTLNTWARNGKGPRPIRLSEQITRYCPNDIDAFLGVHGTPIHAAPTTLKGIPPCAIELPFRREYPCIYFLVHNDEIVYVGQSGNLVLRIGSHITSKKFDRVFYIELEMSDFKFMSEIECAFIRHLKPKLNRTSHGWGHPEIRNHWIDKYMKTTEGKLDEAR